MKKILIAMLFVISFLQADDGLKCKEFNSFKQPDEYIICLHKYIDQNDLIATKQLADFYYMGQQPYKNYQKAIEWYLKIESQDVSAQYTLGQIYTFGGYGINKDRKKALKLYQGAADQNYWAGQDSLGHLYFDGICVPKNREKAKYWIQLGHKNGNTNNLVLANAKLGIN